MGNNVSNTISNLEIELTSTKQKVALGLHAAKICSSTEWDAVINKGYFTQQLNSLTQQLPKVTGEEKELVVAEIAAIGSLKNYIQELLNQSNQAQEDATNIEIELNHQRGLL